MKEVRFLAYEITLGAYAVHASIVQYIFHQLFQYKKESHFVRWQPDDVLYCEETLSKSRFVYLDC